MRKFVFLVLLYQLVAITLHAQHDLSIRLNDPNGEPVSGAMVTLSTITPNDRNWKKVSDSAGFVSFSLEKVNTGFASKPIPSKNGSKNGWFPNRSTP